MARDAVGYVRQGFRIFKVKTGIDVSRNFLVLEQIRAAVGESIGLQVDSEPGGSGGRREVSQPLGVLAIERVMRADNLEAYARLKKVSPVKVMLDESIHSPEDAAVSC